MGFVLFTAGIELEYDGRYAAMFCYEAKNYALYDAAQAPYDPDYYLKKLDDWLERYGRFLGLKPVPAQTEWSFE